MLKDLFALYRWQFFFHLFFLRLSHVKQRRCIFAPPPMDPSSVYNESVRWLPVRLSAPDIPVILCSPRLSPPATMSSGHGPLSKATPPS